VKLVVNKCSKIKVPVNIQKIMLLQLVFDKIVLSCNGNPVVCVACARAQDMRTGARQGLLT